MLQVQANSATLCLPKVCKLCFVDAFRMEQNLASLYVGLKTLLQVLARRRYRNMVINMCGHSTPCMPDSLAEFVEWTVVATNSVQSQQEDKQQEDNQQEEKQELTSQGKEDNFRLYLTGMTHDLSKCVHVEFAMKSLLFGDKKTGVALMRSTLDRLVASRLSDMVTIEQTTPDKQTRLVSAPRPCEACIVHAGTENGATSDAHKYLADLKQEHASHLTVTELTMSQHLRANLLDHPLVPRMMRMSAEESQRIKLKAPFVLNVLPSSDVQVLLLGGLENDVIVKYDDLKTGVVGRTYFRVADVNKDAKSQ